MMYAPKTVLPLSVQKMTGTVLKADSGKGRREFAFRWEENNTDRRTASHPSWIIQGMYGYSCKDAAGIFTGADRWYFRNRNRKCASYISEKYESVSWWNLWQKQLDGNCCTYEREYICSIKELNLLSGISFIKLQSGVAHWLLQKINYFSLRCRKAHFSVIRW